MREQGMLRDALPIITAAGRDVGAEARLRPGARSARGRGCCSCHRMRPLTPQVIAVLDAWFSFFACASPRALLVSASAAVSALRATRTP